MCHLSAKFCENQPSSFCIIPQTNKRTDKQSENIISLQCLKWSKKEAGSLPQAEVKCPSPEFFLSIFDLKMASFDALLVVFYAI